MNDTYEKFASELEEREHAAEVMGLALTLINFLPCLEEDLLDFLAVSVTKEQVDRAKSE